ncbi:MAG: adenosylcobinamide-phosphate synthase CbiB [Sulfuritalea sp.]|nr:adenosylcobinamide-phosphate synthase CbiB [Sulfuritalea sp.]
MPPLAPFCLFPPLSLVAGALAAAFFDRWLGEPRRFHPLVGFGRCADWVENLLRAGAPGHPLGNRLLGLAGWLLLVAPVVALAAWAGRQTWGWITDVAMLYLALGARSLEQHGERVAADLAANDLASARTHVGWMVSRDTTTLDEEGVSRAAVESILENGNDAVFGALFWFLFAGAAGVVMFRLANTLDAMWGYRDDRRRYFGWAAARIDDVLNLIPARLTAMTYALLGNTRASLACWRQQAAGWSSPNAGPVLAAGAGALAVQLGGPALYHGQIEQRQKLGAGDTASIRHIHAALALVGRGLWLWLACAGLLAVAASHA